jgi:hypothetical protein
LCLESINLDTQIFDTVLAVYYIRVALEKWAADDFRSINGQLEWIIHSALREAKRIK